MNTTLPPNSASTKIDLINRRAFATIATVSPRHVEAVAKALGVRTYHIAPRILRWDRNELLERLEASASIGTDRKDGAQ